MCWYNSNTCSSYNCRLICYSSSCGCDYYYLYYSSNVPILMVPCHYYCSSCTAKWSTTSCQSCFTSNSALIMNNAACVSTFASSEGTCSADNQCVASCPTTFYFWLNVSQTPYYPFTSGNSALQTSHFCYLCYFTCKTCSDRFDYTCSSCVLNYYKWQQSRSICGYFCP